MEYFDRIKDQIFGEKKNGFIEFFERIENQLFGSPVLSSTITADTLYIAVPALAIIIIVVLILLITACKRLIFGSSDADVRIGSFNIQHLGRKKFKDDYVIDYLLKFVDRRYDYVIDYLLKIISRYHLLLVQEVQDEDHDNIPSFIEKISKYSGKPYNYVVSDYLGRKTYKEQYLYIYRSDIFQIAGSYHYDDGSEELQEDTFQREPFIVLVKSSQAPVNKFAVVGAHIQPSAVEQEVGELTNVHKNVIRKWGKIPVIMMGDFNAGRSYISKKRLNNLELKKDYKFHWLLAENEDTTVGKNSYTHDRIIASGDNLIRCVIPDSAKAFRFDDQYGLSMEEALRISDHYPVEFMLGSSIKHKIE